MKKFRGSVTVEAAFIVPLILLVISVLITLLFYHHDKVILQAIAHETVTVMSGREDITEETVEEYFREKSDRRLFVFSNIELEIEIEKKRIYLRGVSTSRGMTIVAEASMKRGGKREFIL